MKRKQKRYETEDQIIAEIDAAKKKCEGKNLEATLNESMTQECAKKIAILDERMDKEPDRDKKLYDEWRQLKNEFWRNKESARKARKTAKTIEEALLPALARTLAAFQTVPMAICGADRGVVLER